MRTTALVLLTGLLATGICAAVPAHAPRVNPVNPELRGLQGTWKVITTSFQGQSVFARPGTQWVIRGNALFLKNGNRLVPQGLIEVDSSQKPKAINLVVQGRRALLGVYEIKDHKLTICSAANERPSLFVAEGTHVVNVLERASTPQTLRRHR